MDIKAAVSQTDINAVLQQMRQIRDQTGSAVAPTNLLDGAQQTNGVTTNRSGFGNALKEAINTVNDLQQTASTSKNNFVTGKDTNLVKAMVDGQKASIGFQATVQIRNRMITAYQDIMKMPI